MTCDRFCAAVVEADVPQQALDASTDLAAHHESCPDCRRWFGTFLQGRERWAETDAPSVAAAVLARTGGAACDRARLLMTAEADEPLQGTDATLVAAHMDRCRECQAFAGTWAVIQEGLADLVEMDPGLGFAQSVLTLTSRRPPQAWWAGRLRELGRKLVARPRFAWEAAYVLTLCWLLVFGHPVAAVEWTAARVGAVTRDAVPAQVELARSQVRSLRGQVVADVAQVAAGLGERRATVRSVAESLWQHSGTWVWDRLASIAGLLDAAWRSTVAWVEDLFAAPATPPAPPKTEPAGGPVR